MRKISLLTGLLCTLFFIQCKKEDIKTDFTALCKSYFADKSALNPVDATVYGQNQYNAELLFEMTDSHRKAQGNFFDKYEKAIADVDYSELKEDEKVSYDIIKWEVSIGKEMLKYPTNLIPINQFAGTHLNMGMFAGGTSSQPFKTEKDYRNFLTRMDKFSVWIDSAMVYMKKGVRKGYVLPKALTLKVIPQFEELITEKPEDNLYYSAIKIMPADFPDAVKKELAAQYAETIRRKLVPQFQKMAHYLKTDYLAASRNTSGISSLPMGKEIYIALAKSWTTTEKTPDEIHELGLQQVAKLKAEIEAIKNQVGFKGSMKDFLNDLRTNKKLMPFTTPEQVLAHFDSIYNRIRPNVGKLFSVTPKTPFEIRRTEAFREKSASAEYIQGSADGTRPGVFYVPVPDAKTYNVLQDEDLFLHEAIPGHHYQVSLQQENTALPDFRKFNWFGAYGEGWALYTESLGKELGVYTDPYQYLGMLSAEMHRAIRLVVDTGIHTKGWTREQAIQYSLDNEAETEASIISEIERYMAVPGQALSYKIGQLKIMELREKAKKKMGSKFDIREFHKKVLESGVMPLELLEAKMDAWMGK
ncbi:DUF885 domain-containing protein [Flavobacterium pallidum]|uniref:DUF885 domain-containing protein n=1 Tax=Flavobacterium pallidum TaxID=2172098 RepID=A0A2S1SEC8_9FLAO|nr:DUF885 domain-containing protein [Flavobacterium pallidum]AWI24739.1 DUF885 domain-containing protein [Flavobacterium pallidum]